MTENLITSVNVVVPLFLIVVLGYLLKRWGVTDEGFNKSREEVEDRSDISPVPLKDGYLIRE